MARYYGLPKREEFKCRECGSIKSGNYFISPTLCKKCAAKRRRVVPNIPIQITEKLIVTKAVEKRLRKESAAEIPRTKTDTIIEDVVQRFIFLPFWASAIFVANSLFTEFSGPYWIFVIGWCLIVPIIIDRTIDLIMSKPRKERADKISARIHELAEERKERIEEQEQFYSSPEWAIIRKQVIDEEGYICALCGKKIRKQGDITVDHIKPRSKYPDLALERQNLQVLCRKCNSSKRDEDWI